MGAAQPAYGAATSYVTPSPAYSQAGYGGPIPLTPVMIPDSSPILAEEEGGSGGGGGGLIFKKIIAPLLALPLLLLIPIVVVVVVVVVRVAVVVVPVFFPNFSRRVFGQTTTTPRPYSYEQQPFDYQQGGYSGYNSTGGNYEAPPYGGSQQRRRRETSGGLPALTIGQVEKLTEVVLAAIRSQECVQRLLCEAGSLSRNVSDTAHSVAKSVESFVPESLKSSYEIFTEAEKCEQYSCGNLHVKK